MRLLCASWAALTVGCGLDASAVAQSPRRARPAPNNRPPAERDGARHFRGVRRTSAAAALAMLLQSTTVRTEILPLLARRADVLAEVRQKVHQALDRKPPGAISHQHGDVRLLDPEDLAGLGLGRPRALMSLPSAVVRLHGRWTYSRVEFLSLPRCSSPDPTEPTKILPITFLVVRPESYGGVPGRGFVGVWPAWPWYWAIRVRSTRRRRRTGTTARLTGITIRTCRAARSRGCRFRWVRRRLSKCCEIDRGLILMLQCTRRCGRPGPPSRRCGRRNSAT